jgi:hypothetical protein
MWVFTTAGFLSAVQDKDDPQMIRVRARTENHIEQFAAAIHADPEWIIDMEEVDGNFDYRWVCTIHKDAWVKFLTDESNNLPLGHVKEHVSAGDPDLYEAMLDVWTRMYRLQTGMLAPRGFQSDPMLFENDDPAWDDGPGAIYDIPPKLSKHRPWPKAREFNPNEPTIGDAHADLRAETERLRRRAGYGGNTFDELRHGLRAVPNNPLAEAAKATLDKIEESVDAPKTVEVELIMAPDENGDERANEIVVVDADGLDWTPAGAVIFPQDDPEMWFNDEVLDQANEEGFDEEDIEDWKLV